MSLRFSHSTSVILLLGCLALLGVAAMLYATTLGPVIFSDAAAYLAVAHNILAGQGIGTYEASGEFSASTLQFPFYSFLLAFLGVSGLDVVVIVRWLHAIFFGFVIFLMGWGLFRLTSSRIFALAAGLLVLTWPLQIKLFSQAMTEPTFTLLSLSAAMCLLAALKRDHLGWLAAAAVCTGLCAVTRHVGIAWIVSGALMVLIFWPSGWKRRLAAVFCYGCLSALPVGVLMVWIAFVADAPPRMTNTANVGQRLIEARLAITEVFWTWLPFTSSLPDIHYRLKLLGLLSFFAISATLIFLTTWRAVRHEGGWWVWLQDSVVQAASLLGLSFMVYLGVNVWGYLYSNPTPDLNGRTLSMGILLYLGFVLVACAAVYRAWPKRFWGYSFLLVFAGVSLAASLPQSFQILQTYHREGNGYLDLRWRSSPTRLAVMQLPADTSLISNEHSLLSFWLDRPVYPLLVEPESFDVPFGERADDEIQQVFRQQGAALIVFDTIRWQFGAKYYDQTPQILDKILNGLRLAGEYDDGAIYFYPDDVP